MSVLTKLVVLLIKLTSIIAKQVSYLIEKHAYATWKLESTKIFVSHHRKTENFRPLTVTRLTFAVVIGSVLYMYCPSES